MVCNSTNLFHTSIPNVMVCILQICEILLILFIKRTLHKEFDSISRLFQAYDGPSGYACVPHVWRGSPQVLYGYGISQPSWFLLGLERCPPPPCRPDIIPSGPSWSRRQTVRMPDIGPVGPDMTLRPSTGPLLPFYPDWIYLTKMLLTNVNNNSSKPSMHVPTYKTK